jgi:hypothetical protein
VIVLLVALLLGIAAASAWVGWRLCGRADGPSVWWITGPSLLLCVAYGAVGYRWYGLAGALFVAIDTLGVLLLVLPILIMFVWLWSTNGDRHARVVRSCPPGCRLGTGRATPREVRATFESRRALARDPAWTGIRERRISAMTEDGATSAVWLT